MHNPAQHLALAARFNKLVHGNLVLDDSAKVDLWEESDEAIIDTHKARAGRSSVFSVVSVDHTMSDADRLAIHQQLSV